MFIDTDMAFLAEVRYKSLSVGLGKLIEERLVAEGINLGEWQEE